MLRIGVVEVRRPKAACAPLPPRAAHRQAQRRRSANGYGREGQIESHSRDASLRPSSFTAAFETVTADFIRRSMRSRSKQMPVEALASATSAWMTVRTKKSEAERRQTQFVFCRGIGHGRASQRRGAHLSAFHHGSRPKESFIARDSASGHASWDVPGTRFAHPFERALPAPACPSPAKAPRAPVIVPER